ncbi:MAG: nucleoside-diphosphate kinase [Candidatus Nanohaloarchaeota archaeon QJJ-9]|nr:nucleoside-diphosphate kinase [Candidatus Nanohaloarchaeota archaeon QJJ-9]
MEMEGNQQLERTFVALKPDAVQRGITGQIIHRLERSGMRLAATKMVQADDDLLEDHYSEHVGKDFYKNLVNFMKEGPVVAMVWEGVNAVENVRKLVGETSPKEASPGTIRGDFAHVSYEHADSKDKAVRNIIHASGDPEEAEEEISIWFDEEEIHDYNRSDVKHVR